MQAKVFVLLCAILPTGAQVINIDTFNDGDFTQSNTTAEFTYTGSSMIGGERRVSMPDVTSSTSVGNGVLSVNDPFGAFAVLQYGANSSQNQAKHLHFDASSYPGIQINVTAASGLRRLG